MKNERSPKRLLFTLTAYVLLGSLLSAPALAHGGGLNSFGCHNDNVNGGYHCHRDGEGEESVDAEALLAVLLVGGIVYLVYRYKKNRRLPADSISGLPSTRDVDMRRRDPVKFGLMPATNSRGQVDGLGLHFRFRF